MASGEFLALLLPTSADLPLVTNAAEVGFVESSAISCLTFDDTNGECASFLVVLPSFYSGNGVTVKVLIVSSEQGQAVMQAGACALAGANVVEPGGVSTFGTATTLSWDPGSSFKTIELSLPLNSISGALAGKLLRLDLWRLPGDEDDTYQDDLYVIAVVLYEA
jgi:hypothetical protein